MCRRRATCRASAFRFFAPTAPPVARAPVPREIPATTSRRRPSPKVGHPTIGKSARKLRLLTKRRASILKVVRSRPVPCGPSNPRGFPVSRVPDLRAASKSMSSGGRNRSNHFDHLRAKMAALTKQLLVNHTDAAAMLNVSHVTLLKMRRARTIPFVRVRPGRKGIRYSVLALEKWVARQQTKRRQSRPVKKSN